MVEKQEVKPGKYHGGRPKSQFRTASKENYKRFCLENPKITISFEQYDNILRELSLQYILYCLETGKIVKFRYGLGALSINKKRGKKIHEGHICLPINWDATNKAGKKIYHFNEHTDGFHYKWYWFKTLSRLKLVAIWSFKICKDNSLLLRDYLYKEEKYYLKYREYNLKKGIFK